MKEFKPIPLHNADKKAESSDAAITGGKFRTADSVLFFEINSSPETWLRRSIPPRKSSE